jgi:hypothetical protein
MCPAQVTPTTSVRGLTVGRLNLRLDTVLGIIEATLTVLVAHREPLRADQRAQHIRGPDRCNHALDEIITRVDVVDVFESLFSAKMRNEEVVQSPGRPGRVLTSIADENPAM